MQAFVIDQAGFQHKHDGRDVHIVGIFQDPVIFPDVRGVGHIGGKTESSVEDTVTIFLPVATDCLQQVGDLVFPEIFHLISEDKDVGGSGKGGRAVKGAEPDVGAGVEYDRAFVGDQFVERFPEMWFEPVRKGCLLRIGECRRLLLDDIVDSFTQAFSLQPLQNGWEDVGVQVRERVGHPDDGRSWHIIDDIQQSFGLDVGCLGSATPHDIEVLTGAGQRHDLGERVLVLDGGGLCGFRFNSLPLHPQGILRCQDQRCLHRS